MNQLLFPIPSEFTFKSSTKFVCFLSTKTTKSSSSRSYQYSKIKMKGLLYLSNHRQLKKVSRKKMSWKSFLRTRLFLISLKINQLNKQLKTNSLRFQATIFWWGKIRIRRSRVQILIWSTTLLREFFRPMKNLFRIPLLKFVKEMRNRKLIFILKKKRNWFKTLKK